MTWIEYINQSEQHMLAALFALDNMISTVMEPCTKWAIRRYIRGLGEPASVEDILNKLDQAQKYMHEHSDEISIDVMHHSLLHFSVLMHKEVSATDRQHMDSIVERLKNGPGLGSHDQADPDNAYPNLFKEEEEEEEEEMEEDLIGLKPVPSDVQLSPVKIGDDIAALLRGRKIDE